MPIANPSSNTPTETAAPSGAERHARVLNRMIDAGMVFIDALAQATAAHAKQAAASQAAASQTPAPGPSPLPELADAYDRVTRSVRRTVALAEHLAKPAPAPRAIPAATPAKTSPKTPVDRTAARKRILREVEDAIEHQPASEAALLRAELVERMDSPDLSDALDDDLLTRPITEIIAEIVRDLGLAPSQYGKTWRRRTPADLRTLQNQAARPNATPATPPPNDTNLALKPAPD